MIKHAKADRLVVIGASAGGVPALLGLFEALPPLLNAAVCVVTHISAHTPSMLHDMLARKTTMRVAPAEDGKPVRNGEVYVAVSDRHLLVEGNALRLTRGPKENRSRPAVDVLFRSAAVSFGSRAIGVVLSGMLDDGTAGLWAIADRQGCTLVQDPAEAQFASMPESALRHVQVDFKGPVQALAEEIVRLTEQPPINSRTSAGADGQTLEVAIAGEANALQGGVMGLGAISQYTCPDCHGVLVQIEEGSILRFRCHTGHAFSIKALLVEVGEAIDDGLWTTIRALEERVLLLRQMSEFAQGQGSNEAAEEAMHQADHIDGKIQTLRELVLDPGVAGHLKPQGQRLPL